LRVEYEDTDCSGWIFTRCKGEIDLHVVGDSLIVGLEEEEGEEEGEEEEEEEEEEGGGGEEEEEEVANVQELLEELLIE